MAGVHGIWPWPGCLRAGWAAAPDVVLPPDEPYPFAADDGSGEFLTQRVLLVSGRLLTWYGPSLGTARANLLSAIGRP